MQIEPLQLVLLFELKRCFLCLTALYSLELDWRNIVENPDQLAEKHQHQQTALWEMLQTEVAYIRTLKVVTDVSKKRLISANLLQLTLHSLSDGKSYQTNKLNE